MFSRLSASLITLFSLVAVILALPTDVDELHGLKREDTGSICGSEPTPDAVNEMENAFASLLAGNDAVAPDAGSTVPVYFNVISADTTYSGGSVSDAQIGRQIQVLNYEFRQIGLTFVLAGITRIVNADFFNNIAPEDARQTAMKKALWRGGANALNIYTLGFNNDKARGLLGWSTFPAKFAAQPTEDGILLQYKTLPGGPPSPFDTGRILVHEVGHWVGLYHTFQDGCDGGDLVDDTPAEAGPASGCPVGRDSCPAKPGLDPIQNHMDYSYDACRIQFTQGQFNRLRAQIKVFRGIDI